jgi:hypothetical protein
MNSLSTTQQDAHAARYLSRARGSITDTPFPSRDQSPSSTSRMFSFAPRDRIVASRSDAKSSSLIAAQDDPHPSALDLTAFATISRFATQLTSLHLVGLNECVNSLEMLTDRLDVAISLLSTGSQGQESAEADYDTLIHMLGINLRLGKQERMSFVQQTDWTKRSRLHEAKKFHVDRIIRMLNVSGTSQALQGLLTAHRGVDSSDDPRKILQSLVKEYQTAIEGPMKGLDQALALRLQGFEASNGSTEGLAASTHPVEVAVDSATEPSVQVSLPTPFT